MFGSGHDIMLKKGAFYWQKTKESWTSKGFKLERVENLQEEVKSSQTVSVKGIASSLVPSSALMWKDACMQTRKKETPETQQQSIWAPRKDE